jgi:Mrp family chromosome partitioning ATPase
MASRSPWRRLFKSRKTIAIDEFGGTPDGALVIVDKDGTHLHVTPPSAASALRFLLARVQGPGGDGIPPRLALTSALRGEGVSFMTRSLASVIAYDTDASVMIVDLNWTDPPRPGKDGKLPGSGGQEGHESRAPTLIDAMEDGTDVDLIIQPTSNQRLTFVAPGSVARPRRAAMAGSRALADVLDQLAKRVDHVLLDLPPVLAASDTILLSQLADSYLLVVRQGITSTTQIESALEELRGGDVLGVVLNRFDTHVPRALRRMVGA